MYSKFTLLFTLIALHSAAAQAAFAPPPPTNFIGFGATQSNNSASAGFPISDLSNLTVIVGGKFNPTSGNYEIFKKVSPTVGTSQYQVDPTGVKNLYVYGYYIFSTNSAQQNMGLGYGTAALASNDTATPPTGEVPYGPNNTMNDQPYVFEGGSKWLWVPQQMMFPNQTYPFWRASSSTTDNYRIMLVGVEK